MKEFINKLISSLDNHNKGFSARKLSALIIMLCVVFAHISWLKKAFIEDDFTLLSEVLIIDYGFISVCLGMTTYESIKKSKTDGQSTNQ